MDGILYNLLKSEDIIITKGWCRIKPSEVGWLKEGITSFIGGHGGQEVIKFYFRGLVRKSSIGQRNLRGRRVDNFDLAHGRLVAPLNVGDDFFNGVQLGVAV